MNTYTYTATLPGGQKLEAHSDSLEAVRKAIEFVSGLTEPKKDFSPYLDASGNPFWLEAGVLYMAPVIIDEKVVGRHPVVVAPVEIRANLYDGTWRLTAVVIGGDDRHEIAGELGEPHPLIHKLTDCCRDIIT